MTENTAAPKAPAAAKSAPKAPAAPRRRATAKSGDPKADRAARDQAAAKSTAKAAPKPKAAPKSKADIAEELKAKVPAGYELKWPHGGHSLLKRTSGDGPAWKVLCNAHGSLADAKNAKDAEETGAKARRSAWCKDCKTAGTAS